VSPMPFAAADAQKGCDNMAQQDYDQILMERMVFHSHVGVLAHEKENGQDFVIDVIFYCQPLAACQSDDLSQTINYGQAFRLIRQIVEEATCDLIERLAGLLADRLLMEYPLAEQVQVTVRKPQAPVDGRFDAMGVRILRRRS
jgi:7,8-dihydroneopterin aldolase/epimerase/oxygenase